MRAKKEFYILIFLSVALTLFSFNERFQRLFTSRIYRSKKKTVDDRIRQYGDGVRFRLSPAFKRIGMAFPPDQVVLVGLKQERVLEVWVSKLNEPAKLLKTYPILGASGKLGPKLMEGDLQVPEGVYRIESLNPNSKFHLALRVNYPNSFDKAKGKIEGRDNLGKDIMIHGKSCSAGCLAMGNEAIEELFFLAALTGIHNVSVILSPLDFRVRELPSEIEDLPDWVSELYDLIKRELKKLLQT